MRRNINGDVGFGRTGLALFTDALRVVPPDKHGFEDDSGASVVCVAAGPLAALDPEVVNSTPWLPDVDRSAVVCPSDMDVCVGTGGLAFCESRRKLQQELCKLVLKTSGVQTGSQAVDAGDREDAQRPARDSYEAESHYSRR